MTFESYAKQTIHMNCQDLLLMKDKKKKINKMLSATVVIGTSRVNSLSKTYTAMIMKFLLSLL